jgi:uncharacterized protein
MLPSCRIAVVDYFRLEPQPVLVAQECCMCAARYFGRRSGCASCGGVSFVEAEAGTTGYLRTFTVVYRAPPGVTVPFVSAVVELDGGGAVQANLVEIDPDPSGIELGMPVHLVTFSLGEDGAGTEAVAFAFAPGR